MQSNNNKQTNNMVYKFSDKVERCQTTLTGPDGGSVGGGVVSSIV